MYKMCILLFLFSRESFINMLALILSILFSVILLVNFRLHPRFKVNTFQAIIFNYPVCILSGLLFLPSNQHFSLDFSQNATYYALLLGIGFVLTFLLSGVSTQRMGMTATSLANNISLVIPVLFSLIVFKMSQSFDWLNYLGLGLAILAVVLSTFKKEEGVRDVNRLDWLLPLGVFVMYGITNTTFNYLNAQYVTASGQTIPFTLTILSGSVVFGLLIFAYRLAKGLEVFSIKSVWAAFPLGIPNFLSFYYLLKALDAFNNNGAYVLPLYNISVILISSVVGMVFFKEKLSLINKIGLGIAVLAIILISHQGLIS